MSELAIDRFRAKPLRPDLEAQARRTALEFRRYDADVMLGWLTASVAIALERPRWRSRDRLAVDLRVIELVKRYARSSSKDETT